jgi:hypothetical protein
VTSPWVSVGAAAHKLRLAPRNVQLYIHAGALQAIAVECPGGRVFFAVHRAELRRFNDWLLMRRQRRPRSVGKGQQVPLPLLEAKPWPWTFARFAPKMIRAELTRAYREAARGRVA